MDVSRDDFEEFVSLLSEDDKDDRAMLEALRGLREAHADPRVQGALEAQQQRRATDDSMIEGARSEGKTARLRGPARIPMPWPKNTRKSQWQSGRMKIPQTIRSLRGTS
jgi:hypothetical protein